MKKIRVGILGGGAIAQRRHLPEYAENPKAEIAGLYDVDAARAEELCEKYGGRAYAGLDEMLADETIDAISVCTPNFTHAENTIRALEAGKHVLCEKPMALTLDETRRMLAAERASGAVFKIFCKRDSCDEVRDFKILGARGRNQFESPKRSPRRSRRLGLDGLPGKMLD